MRPGRSTTGKPDAEVKETSWLIAGSPGKENRRLSDTPPSNAPLRLDRDALGLLEAIHRGCVVRLDDGDGLRWHVEPRVVVPMRLYDEDEITLVDLDSDEMLSGVVAGPRRHMPDWPLDRPHLRLGAGVLLIRNALAVRKGIMLSATQTGRALAASRIGDGVDIAGRPAAVDPAVVPPNIVISDEPIDMSRSRSSRRNSGSPSFHRLRTMPSCSGLMPAAGAWKRP